jgi:hypothetical protein
MCECAEPAQIPRIIKAHPLDIQSSTESFGLAYRCFEEGPAVGTMMGGCMDLIPPSPKFELHAGIRRFNVLVHIDEFGIADGRDNLVADTDAVTDIPTLRRYRFSRLHSRLIPHPS